MDHVITLIDCRSVTTVRGRTWQRSIAEAITLPSAACYILRILPFSGVYVSGIWGERRGVNVFG